MIVDNLPTFQPDALVILRAVYSEVRSHNDGNIRLLHRYMLTLMLSSSLPVYQVRLDWLPLPCIALIRPNQLSCLGSSVGRVSAS